MQMGTDGDSLETPMPSAVLAGRLDRAALQLTLLIVIDLVVAVMLSGLCAWTRE